MIFKNLNNNILFLHIPRTGGTYIERLLCSKFKVNIIWPIANLNNLFGLMKYDDNKYFTLQHLTLKEAIDFNFYKNVPDQDYIFTVTRNPYERILSLYSFFTTGQFDNIDKFLQYLKDIEINKYNFTGMNVNIDGFNYKTMTRHLSIIKYFFIPQYLYIYQDVKKLPINIFEYKNMELINNDINLNIKFNQNKKREIDKQLTPKSIDLINDLYHIDFDMFKYNFL